MEERRNCTRDEITIVFFCLKMFNNIKIKNMKKHHFFNIEWINFPDNKNRKVKGCYLIGDCYVGASEHIRARILNHLSGVYLVSRNEFVTYNIDSSDKNKYLYDCLVNNKPIKVTYISDDPMKEKEMYIKYNIPIKSNTIFYHQIYKNKI